MNDEQQSMISFMCERIIKPYADYLMKVFVREGDYACEMEEDKMWMLIN